MDLVYRGRTRFGREKRGTVAYQHTSCHPYRERLFDQLHEGLARSKRMGPSALSRCAGASGNHGYVPADDGGCPNGTRFDKTVCRYEEFLFAETLEHKASYNSVGYVSEKIVDAFLAGAVPIYSGAAQVNQIFNPKAFVHADVSSEEGMQATVGRVLELLENRTKYERMRRIEPVVSHAALRKFFSWHPAVWKTHGDELRWKILVEVLRHCGRMLADAERQGGGAAGAAAPQGESL
mmetsp:Transcript_35465/g.112752  ORF Transcript_35465/g.112752 Transcript_35465/m.112752 type:complete len:236 (+) Transcript_35465:2-709(+)